MPRGSINPKTKEVPKLLGSDDPGSMGERVVSSHIERSEELVDWWRVPAGQEGQVGKAEVVVLVGGIGWLVQESRGRCQSGSFCLIMCRDEQRVKERNLQKVIKSRIECL
ncbi:hypothetical protein K438DRAFT_1767155 [Mycena galopus ATCC 62051]|nr:hypothetical protein K438DRAFT_1767155 [Mycena galopus ATCC 62051]